MKFKITPSSVLIAAASLGFVIGMLISNGLTVYLMNSIREKTNPISIIVRINQHAWIFYILISMVFISFAAAIVYFVEKIKENKNKF